METAFIVLERLPKSDKKGCCLTEAETTRRRRKNLFGRRWRSVKSQIDDRRKRTEARALRQE